MNNEKQIKEAPKHINVACVGNPNCGKTTLFNALTGAKLKVANWPGVTVEKVEGEIHDVQYADPEDEEDWEEIEEE